MSGRTSAQRADGNWEIPLWAPAFLLVSVFFAGSVGVSANRLSEARIIGLIDVRD